MAPKQSAVGKFEDKARKKAAKKGVPIDGALFVAYELSKDSHWQTLVLWDDRIEFHDHGDISTLTRKGSGLEIWHYSKILTVQTSKAGMIYSHVTLSGAGDSLAYRAGHDTAEHIRGLVQERLGHSAPAAQSTAASSDADEIRKLADLRDAGILTEDEFAAKKAQILGL